MRSHTPSGRHLVAAAAVALTAVAVLTAISPTASGASPASKEYAATFEPSCIVAPGVLNILAKLKVTIRAHAPERLEPGEVLELRESSSTIISPAELSESFHALGVKEVRGHVLDFALDASGLEPAVFNVGKPAEFPTGLPFFAPVEPEKPVTFAVPSLHVGEAGRTYAYGPLTVTGAAGSVAKVTVDTSAGYEEVSEGGYRATGKGIVSEIEGFNEAGEKDIGPLKVACTAPPGVVVAEIPVGTTPPPPPSGPTVTAISPHANNTGQEEGCAGGTPVTITGTNFVDVTGVFFGGVPARSFEVTSSEQITAVSPGSSGDVTVATGGGTSPPVAADVFTDYPRPSITSIEPSQGPSTGGTHVTLRGAEFEDWPILDVVVGGNGVPAHVVSDSEMTFTTPPGSGTATVTIATPGCLSAAARFTYTTPAATTEYKNWSLTGTLTPRALGQAIALPVGATFNGSAEVGESGAGTVKGTFAVPPFSSRVRLLGMLPTTIGATLAQLGSVEGTIGASESSPGEETLTLPARFSLGVTSVSLLGLTIPTVCHSEPLALDLTDTASREELLTKRWSFAGDASLPRFSCQGGVLGSLFGVALSGLFGSETAYSLTASPPAG